jgi:hypothetical protein
VSGRVTDTTITDWLVWARNFGEVVAYRVGSGRARRFRVRVTPGITRNGAPLRPKGGLLDFFGHTEEDVVPAELMLTAREALVFAYGCAVGRAAALADGEQEEWRVAMEEAWTPEARAAFHNRREAAREADVEERDREVAEQEERRQQRIAEHRRRKAAAARVLDEGGSS